MNKEITKVESVETKDLLEKVAKIEELEFESRGLLETIPKPVPVPLKNQTLYSQEDMINLSMGKKGYFNIMAQKFREKPSRISTGIFELDEVTGGRRQYFYRVLSEWHNKEQQLCLSRTI